MALKHNATLQEVVEHILSRCVQDGNCKLWSGAVRTGSVNSYGTVTWLGEMWSTHRLVAAHTQERPDILQNSSIIVCHSCDRSLCQEPAHLVIADQSYNIRDAIEKKRFTIPTTKGLRTSGITDKQIDEMIRLHKAGWSYRDIGDGYRVSNNTVRRLTNLRIAELSQI